MRYPKKLVVAEKPSVARDIAETLGCTEKKEGYIEGLEYIVTWAVGHLIGLKNPEEHDEKYKFWRLSDLPLKFPLSESLKVLEATSSQFKVIKKLIQSDGICEVINAGDSGREGLLIQSWIYRMAGNTKPVKVLWISSFTKEAILEGFRNLHAESEFSSLLEEAESRAQADWVLGMNYSRALTICYGGKTKLLSYGRCQTPLLNLICQREKEIREFKSVPYYNIEATFGTEEGEYTGILVNDDLKNINFATKEDAKNVENATSGMPGKIKNYRSAQKRKKAPLLFDLSSLQQTCGSKYGFTADKTLEIAQSLYEKHKILSYPRTDSKYLSSDLLLSIHNNLQKCCFGEFAPIVNKIKEEGWSIAKDYCNDKKVTDHPALIPTTGDIEKAYPNLTEDEKKVFDLVVKRFLAIYFPPYLYESTEIQTQVEGYTFLTRGTVPLSMGYKDIYDDSQDKEKDDKKEEEDTEKLLPKVNNGQSVENVGEKILDKKTQCPKRYTAGTIITLMEKYNIGTPATRASIIEKLIKRKFIALKKAKYEATEIGESLISIVPDNLKSPELTNEVEKKLTQINEGTLKSDDFIDDTIEEIVNNIVIFKEEKEKNGEALRKAMEKENMVAECPICNEGVILARKGKESGKIFYGCSRYKEGCKFILSETIYGRKFSKGEIGKLCKCIKADIPTPTLSGFYSQKSDKEYSAALKWDKEKQSFTLIFENKADKKTKKAI